MSKTNTTDKPNNPKSVAISKKDKKDSPTVTKGKSTDKPKSVQKKTKPVDPTNSTPTKTQTTKTETKAKTETKTETKAKAETDSSKKAGQVKTETKPETKTKADTKTEAEPKTETKAKPKTKTKPDTKTETKVETKAENSKTAGQVKTESTTNKQKKEKAKLLGLYAFKLKMSSIYDEKGHFTPVTFLKFKPWVVSQIKTKQKEGYNSVQVALNKPSSKALKKQANSARLFAHYIREIRQKELENIKIGQEISIHSLQKGDKVTVQAISKGHGFAGVVKRWGFRGGPASHGSTIHRTSGSIGNRTEPARVMPGKKMAGHYGAEKISLKNVPVVDVLEDDNLIVLKGPVPGGRNGLVYLKLESRIEQ